LHHTPTIQSTYLLSEIKMKKEKLRKEFVSAIQAKYPKENIDSWDDVDFAFDWFWSKLEEKDKFIAIRDVSIKDLCIEIETLEAKLKAADEVIDKTKSYIGDTVYINEKFKELVKALEHYKSLQI